MQTPSPPESAHITDVGAADLIGTEWRVIWVAGDTPVPGREPRISFGARRIEGSDGCDEYSGPAAVDSGSYRPGDLDTSNVACPDLQTHEVAARFVAILSHPQPIGLDDQRRLVIGPPDNRVVFVMDRGRHRDDDRMDGG